MSAPGYLQVTLNATVLDGVLSVNADQGIRNETEPFRGGTISFEYLQSVNGTATPTPDIGAVITVKWVRGSVSPTVMVGNIVDVEFNYTLAGVNTFRVTCSDLIGVAGQATLANVTVAAGSAESQIAWLTAQANISRSFTIDLYTNCSGYTYTGNLLDILNKICATGQSIMTCTGAQLVFTGRRGLATTTSSYTFGRSSNSSTFRFDAVNVASAIQNRFNYIVVSPDGLANVASSYPVSGAKKSFEVATLNQNTTDAQYLADYLWGKYSNTTEDLEAVSFTMEAQYSDAVSEALINLGIGSFIGVQVTPSSTIYGYLIGRSFSGTPSGTRGTYYFSGSGLNDYLELDNAQLGKLDTGRLGY